VHFNKVKYLVVLIVIAGLIILYKNFDPAIYSFPKCPFKQLTGFQCPGCGSQRAVHHILNLELKDAFLLNPLLLISIPYILMGLIFEHSSLNDHWLRIRKILFGPKAMKLILAIVLVFWIGRNILP
jgi:TRAP-type mannitol/chloroaromatic compound transport system permease large subunit